MRRLALLTVVAVLAGCGGTPPKPSGAPPQYESYDAGTPQMESAPAPPPPAAAAPDPTAVPAPGL